MHTKFRAIGLSLAALLGASLRGDEGMWTFDNLPAAKIQAKYGFAPDAAWLEHARLAALRLPGGSGAFISADGLVLTNHHVAHSWIEKIADAGHDYVRDGFIAGDRSRELPVPGLEVRTLMAMENVTAALAQAVRPSSTDAQADRARKEALARLVQAAETRTGLASEPVTLYHGGETWIYSYQVHSDVRLVLAPEYDIAAFGHDWDNFTFPRHDLDFTLFRVYEHGAPYHPSHFLRWSRTGLQSGDLTFVVGHPGRTSRLDTLAQMEAVRDVLDPFRLRSLDRTRKALHAFAARGPEQARLVSAQLLSLENSYKICQNELAGLHDPVAMARVAEAERQLRVKVAQEPRLQASTGQSWTKVQQAVQSRCAIVRESAMLDGRGSRALAFALGLARWKAEAARPVARRALGYRTARDLDNLKASLAFSDRLDPGVEQAGLAQGLQEALDELGPAHPIVALLLDGSAPRERAEALVRGTRLLDPAARAALAQAAPGAVLTSADPMVALARRIVQLARPYRRQNEEADTAIAEAGARINQARFAVTGKADYPDASFTLRISYGCVESCPGNGTLIQPFTTFGGLYDRADGWGPEVENHSWALPSRWRARRAALDPATPLNFISSNDIIGGNSGSPVLDRRGELAGLVFDGNIATVSGRFYYDPRANRSVSVDSRAILAALDKVYEVPALVQEILAPDPAGPHPAIVGP
ncbi:MAG: S46 family peptidase [Holophaga sp.]|nr:S46 family peptidase [Holophaga sp.]